MVSGAKQFLLLLAVSALMSTASGCEIGRTMFQMNSDAPMPQFGIDLLPRKKKESSLRSISQKEDTKAEIITAKDEPKKRTVFGWPKQKKEIKPIPLNLPQYKFAERDSDSSDDWNDVPVEDF